MVKLSHDLSTITPQQMEALGCALGCSNANTEMMMKCSSMQECILSLLQMWVRNYHLPTKERLAQALKKSGCLDMTIRLTASSMYILSGPLVTLTSTPCLLAFKIYCYIIGLCLFNCFQKVCQYNLLYR